MIELVDFRGHHFNKTFGNILISEKITSFDGVINVRLFVVSLFLKKNCRRAAFC
jgi:hypothetical protein